MKEQVITVDPDGTISGLQVKKGKGLDLTTLGRSHIERVSEIVWSLEWQCWFVKVLSSAVIKWMQDVWSMSEDRPGVLTWELWCKATEQQEDLNHAKLPYGCEEVYLHILHFKDYDDAVAAEVEFLNALRLKGIC